MPDSTPSFYNRFVFFYPIVDLFLKKHKKQLENEVNMLPPGYLLDIGVGTGSHLNAYRKHHGIGIDTSEAMLGVARSKAFNNIRLVNMDGQALDFKDESFDIVIASHVVAVVHSPDKLLSEAFRVLKPGGTFFLLNHFTPDNWLGYIDRFFQPLARRLHFKALFRIEQLPSIREWRLVKEINLRPSSYFKLLIFRKVEK